MKIKAVDVKGDKPLAFTHIRLVVKDKDSGFLRVKTDGNGFFELDDIYAGEQIGGTVTNIPGIWITAKPDAVLRIEFAPETTPVDTET